MSSKSLEELLSLLGEEKVEKKEQDDVELFIEELKITPSPTNRITARVIYWFYLEWKTKGRGNEKELFNRNNFFKRFSNFFEKGRCDERYYKISCDTIKVNRWQKEEIQRDLKSEREYHKKEKRKRKRLRQKRKGILSKPQG